MATEAELESLITTIDEAIAEFTADPASMTSYKIGSRSFDKTSSIKGLVALRKIYRTQLENMPVEVWTQFDEPEQ